VEFEYALGGRPHPAGRLGAGLLRLVFQRIGREVAAIVQANRGMTWELSVEMIELSGKIDVDSVPTTNSPLDISFGAAKQSVIDTQFGREGLEAFNQAKIINMAK
jgi:hypothetical protein